MLRGRRIKEPGTDDLLLGCCLLSGDSLNQHLDAVNAGPGWSKFLQAADREDLSELVYHNLRQPIAEKLIPYDAAKHLKKKYVTTLARNVLFLQKLDEVAAAFDQIDFIVLKGAYLGSHVYGNPGVRRFADIDILIRRADVLAADERLVSLGYKRLGGKDNAAGDTMGSGYLNSFIYRHSERSPAIHVHWHLFNSILPKYMATNMDIDNIWKAALTTTGGSFEMRPEHLLIHLGDHALRHSFDRLILVCDIAEVIRQFRADIDWDYLIAESGKFNLARPVYYSLLFVSRKTDVSVPGWALTALKPQHGGAAENLFAKLMMKGIRRPELCNLAYFDAMETFRNKCAFLWRTAFPPRSVLAQAYGTEPCEISAGDYLRRMWRGIGYARRATRHLLRRMY